MQGRNFSPKRAYTRGATELAMPTLVLYITAGMLFLRAAPLPYGDYALLPLVVTLVFAWAAVEAHRIDRKVLPYIYGVLAILFNPVVPVHLDKDTWFAIDIGVGMFVLTTARSFTVSPIGEDDSQ